MSVFSIRRRGGKALAVFMVIGLCLAAGWLLGAGPGYPVPGEEPPLTAAGTDWLNPSAWAAAIGLYAWAGLLIRLPFRLRRARTILKTPVLSGPVGPGRPRKRRLRPSA